MPWACRGTDYIYTELGVVALAVWRGGQTIRQTQTPATNGHRMLMHCRVSPKIDPSRGRSVRPNLFRDCTAVTRTSKLTVFREMGSFPWNSVKYCNFVRLLIHFLNIFPMPVLCSAFAITFIQIINNYPLKCNPFSLCLLTVQQSSDVTLIWQLPIALNVSPCQSVIWRTKSSLPRTPRLRIEKWEMSRETCTCHW